MISSGLVDLLQLAYSSSGVEAVLPAGHVSMLVGVGHVGLGMPTG